MSQVIIIRNYLIYYWLLMNLYCLHILHEGTYELLARTVECSRLNFNCNILNYPDIVEANRGLDGDFFWLIQTGCEIWSVASYPVII